MRAGFKLHKTMLCCAKDYNHNNTLEWGERKTYGQMAEDMANKLHELGYYISPLGGITPEEIASLDDESNLTGE